MGSFRLEEGKAERCWNPIRVVQNQATGELMDPQFFGTIGDLLPLAVGDLWPILDSDKLWEAACIPFPVRDVSGWPYVLIIGYGYIIANSSNLIV